MSGVFDYRDLGQSAPSQDTELTLSPTSLLLIIFALVVLCGLCFGLGYATGHHSSQDNSAALPSDSNAPPAFADTGRAKPSGDTQAPVATQPTASTDEQGSAGSNTAASNTAGSSVQSAAAAGDSSAASSQVKPAFGSTATPVQSAQPVTSAVSPAMSSAPAASLMVQIAAVSQPEDSDVLVSALRKRGYAVFARREPLDGLIHVKIGPFKTADEADKWRQKLLNDGYNAIIQQ